MIKQMRMYALAFNAELQAGHDKPTTGDAEGAASAPKAPNAEK